MDDDKVTKQEPELGTHAFTVWPAPRQHQPAPHTLLTTTTQQRQDFANAPAPSRTSHQLPAPYQHQSQMRRWQHPNNSYDQGYNTIGRINGDAAATIPQRSAYNSERLDHDDRMKGDDKATNDDRDHDDDATDDGGDATTVGDNDDTADICRLQKG
ncbi:hypothetical protein EDB84DRAFT_1441312 [Lactarius hengduanensis]|nr:hypothetical protein EDB84DRAFT_1441312 [Lactarius hengduanensis]